MKLLIPILTLVSLSPLLLTQCATSTPTKSVSGNSAKSQKVYDRGYNQGLKDGRAKLSRNPGRHDGSRAKQSDAFNSGYQAGYNKGIL